jgi:DNA (cytosine-5)-methyltransferase 1
MGYKLAGCDVLGCCEIDPKMNEVYVKNHNPKYNYVMDIRDFNRIPNDELPSELLDIDILDGSPPCTTFSLAGDREKSWGKKKKFREGQKEQTLDDLSFVFIETIKKLKPKTAIIENVEGLLLGEAFAYVQKIYKQIEEAGYKVHHWLLKGELMGIPQKRHRVFFIAIRNDVGIDPVELNLSFNYSPVTYADIKEGTLHPIKPDQVNYRVVNCAVDDDRTIADTRARIGMKPSSFQTRYVRDNDIPPTQRGKADLIDIKEKAYVGWETIRNIQTFPRDYNFIEFARSNVAYICGMSVPPIMMKRIVQRLIDEGVFNYKIGGENGAQFL